MSTIKRLSRQGQRIRKHYSVSLTIFLPFWLIFGCFSQFLALSFQCWCLSNVSTMERLQKARRKNTKTLFGKFLAFFLPFWVRFGFFVPFGFCGHFLALVCQHSSNSNVNNRKTLKARTKNSKTLFGKSNNFLPFWLLFGCFGLPIFMSQICFDGKNTPKARKKNMKIKLQHILAAKNLTSSWILSNN